MNINQLPINQQPLTPARWRRLPSELCAELRQVLGGTQAIINRQVLDVAKALCARGAHGVALDLYDALNGEPPPYECGLGRTLRRRALMGEDHKPWVYGAEEAPLLLPTQHRPRGEQENA
jgi:hypothetical protein